MLSSFSIYYTQNDKHEQLKDRQGNAFQSNDMIVVFNTAKQLSKQNANIIISIVDNETGSILVDFQ